MKGTITSKQRITQLFESGSKYSCARVLVLYAPCEANKESTTQESKVPNSQANHAGRVAYVAGKRLGSAPVRSRAKRRLREAAAANRASWAGYDVVIVARSAALSCSFSALVADFKQFSQALESAAAREANAPHGGLAPQCAQEHTHDGTAACNGGEDPALQCTPARGNVNAQVSESAGGGAVRNAGKILTGIPSALAVLCINVYRHAISPFLPPSCRYVPTCSEYALIAVKRFGFLKGLVLAGKRIGRCHPLAQGGYDPVPERW